MMSDSQDPDSPSKEQATISASSADSQNGTNTVAIEQQVMVKGFRFWAIILSLSITGALSTLEATIVSTALPTIITNLNGGDKYLWVGNAYLLSM